jgi:hypothetical protein
MENHNLDLFLIEMGIIPKKTEVEELEDQVDLKAQCMTKWCFNDPRDENGEVPF